MMIMDGFLPTHFAITTFCWLPPDRDDAGSWIDCVLTPSFLDNSSAKDVSLPLSSTWEGQISPRFGNVILEPMEKSRIKPSLFLFSVMKAIPALMASSGFLQFRTEPFTVTVPPLCLSTPKMARMISVRPAPIRPATPRISPLRKEKEISLLKPSGLRLSTLITTLPGVVVRAG